MSPKMKKKTFIISLLCFFILSTKICAAPLTFTDYNGDMYVDWLVQNDIFNGYPDLTFKPEQYINRAELLKVLIKSIGMTPDASKYNTCFPDIHNEWFAPYVCYAYEQRWIQGYNDGTFKPEQTVSVAEGIKMALEVIGIPIDDDEIYELWYIPYVLKAEEEKITDIILEQIHYRMKRIDVANLLAKALFVKYNQVLKKTGINVKTSYNDPAMKEYIENGFSIQHITSDKDNEFDTWVNEHFSIPEEKVLSPICISNTTLIPQDSWGWYLEGELILKETCNDGDEGICMHIGSNQEGWYKMINNTFEPIHIEFCGNMEIEEERNENIPKEKEFISKGSFAELLVKKSGLTIITHSTPHFSDVPEDHPYYTYIETLQHKGTIMQDIYNRFYPDQNISYGEASMMIIAIYKIPIGYPSPSPWVHARDEIWFDAINTLYYLVGSDIFGNVGPTYDAPQEWVETILEEVIKKL